MKKKIHIGVPKKPSVGDVYTVNEEDGKKYYKVSIILNEEKGWFSSRECDANGNVITKKEIV